MTDLKGRVALVTGAAKNIGRGIALALGEQGCSVALNTAHDRNGLDQVVAEIARQGGRATSVIGDVSNPSGANAIYEEAVSAFGRIDILINNAVLRRDGSIQSMSVAAWEECINTNLKGPFMLAQLCAPAMIDNQWGRIINFSGIDAFRGAPNRTAIGTAKMGIVGFTRALAAELGPHGITANVVAPGWMDTKRRVPLNPEYWEKEKEYVPARRWGTPAEIGATCAFLCSDGAAFISGQTIGVNGGQYMT